MQEGVIIYTRSSMPKVGKMREMECSMLRKEKRKKDKLQHGLELAQV
jgi:hypothetical protein